MAQSYLLFDFGANEQAAQQGRHRIEGWRQAFRLDKKLQLKFERLAQETKLAQEIESEQPAPEKTAGAKAKRKGTAGKKSQTKAQGNKQNQEKGNEKSEENERIRLIVRLDFSDHEKLSHSRWLERIPSEEPFKDAAPKIVRQGEADFDATAELFRGLP